MEFSSSFRRRLAARLLLATAIVAPPALLTAEAGCSSDSGGSTGMLTEECIDWPPPNGAGGGSAGGSDAGADDAGSLACPSLADAPMHFNMGVQDCADGTPQSGPVVKPGMCCYQVVEQSCGNIVGRPYLVESAPRAAAAMRARETDWKDRSALLPRTSDLTMEERAELAAEWARDGLFEHASIASFGRFALELLAIGAPSVLVEGAHQAAIDEVRHARRCLGLASVYAGESIAPATFPFGGRIEVSADIADIAARTVHEGCVGETIAAMHAAEQLDRAEDAAVRAALKTIAEDEARHAELAWRTVAWAVEAGGERVRIAVERAFEEALGDARAARPRGSASAALGAHGRLDSNARRRAVALAIEELIVPSIAALFSTRTTDSASSLSS